MGFVIGVALLLIAAAWAINRSKEDLSKPYIPTWKDDLARIQNCWLAAYDEAFTSFIG